MTLEELRLAIKSNTPLSLDEISDAVKPCVEFSLRLDNISMSRLILDPDTFEDYMDLKDMDSFKKAIVNYIKDGLDAEYSIRDLIKVTLK